MEYLTRAEAAAYLRVSVRSLFEARRAGRLAFIQIGDRIVFTRADLDAFMEQQRRGARKTPT